MLGLIPAAGKGTRFHELGKQYPKCILPYKEVPIIIHNIRALVEAGCDEIIIGAHFAKIDMIKEVVSNWCTSSDFAVRVVNVGKSNSMPSTIHSLIADEKCSGENVLIMLGDVVIEGPIPEERSYDWLSVTEVEDFERWCMVELDPMGEVVEFHDKCEDEPPTDLAASGLYYFTDVKELFLHLRSSIIQGQFEEEEELQLSSVMSRYTGMRCFTPTIIDLGTHKDYLENRGLTRCRSFNSVTKDGLIISKTSHDVEKIRAEYHWFNDLPVHLKSYIPHIHDLHIGEGEATYRMEYIDKPTLRELYLFLDGSTKTWTKIFDDIFDMSIEMSNIQSYESKFMTKMLLKTEERADDVAMTVDEHRLWYEFSQHFDSMVDEHMYNDSLSHGDLCFSNIMWSESGIKLIDPRGEYFGNVYYEVAKLYHSVVCGYDFIDAELYSVNDEGEVKIYNDGKEEIIELFMNKLRGLFSREEILFIKTICASLFISMIPLHDHNELNQKLYLDIFKKLAREVIDERSSM